MYILSSRPWLLDLRDCYVARESLFQSAGTRAHGESDAAVELVNKYESTIRVAVRIRLTDPRLRRQFDSMDVCQSVLASFFVHVAMGAYVLHEPRQLVALLTKMAQNKLNMRACASFGIVATSVVFNGDCGGSERGLFTAWARSAGGKQGAIGSHARDDDARDPCYCHPSDARRTMGRHCFRLGWNGQWGAANSTNVPLARLPTVSEVDALET